MLLVCDDIELGIARRKWQGWKGNGPQFVGLSFAGEDFKLILVDMNLIFIKDDPTIIVT